jgi:pyruvate carboxylase
MIACAEAGADAVDAASDSMSGMTSQPSIGAILSSLEGTDYDTGLNGHNVRALDQYWSQLRLLYSPFEAGLTGPDPVSLHTSFRLASFCLSCYSC